MIPIVETPSMALQAVTRSHALALEATLRSKNNTEQKIEKLIHLSKNFQGSLQQILGVYRNVVKD